METVTLSPETDFARESFFKLAFGRATGYVCIAHMKPTDRKSFTETFFQYPDEMPRILDLINSLVRGHNIYFCPQLFAERKRTKETVEATPTAWADLDHCDPVNLLIKPTIVIESSPDRFQALWTFDREVDPDDAEDLSQRIAYKHAEQGADRSGWDLTQLLRVPLTYNYKYKNKTEAQIPIVKTIEVSRNRYRLSEFEDGYPPVSKYHSVDTPMPDKSEIPPDANDLLVGKRLTINAKIWSLFLDEPGTSYDLDKEGWSKPLWSLQMMLFEAGFSREEVFCIAREAACNKYARDGKPAQQLWKEVCRAEAKNQHNVRILAEGIRDDEERPLLSEEERELVQRQEDTFIERYITWARSLGDAAPQYHQAGAFVALSSLLAGPVRLPTSFGTIIPNLWFMILADSCQPLESKLLTPTGWTTMEQIQAGDYVIGRNGEPTLVEATSSVREDDVYRITLLDGSSTECTEDHLWTVKASYERTITLSELQERWSRENNKPVLPRIDAPVQFNTQTPVPVNPYIVGIWIAEGVVDRRGYYASFSNTEEELIEEVRHCLPPGLYLNNYGHASWYINTGWKSRGPSPHANPVRNGLWNLGLLETRDNQRFIPDAYKYTSIENRTALLQGILDGDGHCMKNGHVKLDTVSKRLADNVVELIRSLGGKAQINGPTKGKTSERCQLFWTVTFTPHEGLVPFRLKRKIDRLKKSHRWSYHGIKSLEYVGKKPVRCIKVAAPDGLYVTDDYIVTHNTITRKTTSMDTAMDLVTEIDPDALLATDGSLEGLLSSMAQRPGRPSVFLRDEFSGLLEMMTKKDYYAGMAETLTKLYDGKMQKRVLRRETVEVREPILVTFAGGIKNRVTSLLSWDHVSSGFMPRFIFITAESDVTKIRPIGPPTQATKDSGEAIRNELADLAAHYRQTTSITIKSTGSEIHAPKRFEAELTDDAWVRYNRLETLLVETALKSERPDVMTPTYDRLSKSILKAAVLLSAARQRGNTIKVEETDILRAIMYGEQWRVYVREVMKSVGKGGDERQYDTIANLVRKNPGVTRSRIMQNFHLNARTADQTFSTLEQRGLIRRQKTGRTEQFYPLDPVPLPDSEIKKGPIVVHIDKEEIQ